MSSLLEARAISKRYGEQKVLDSVDIEVRSGEFVSIIGPSGAGKSTLLKILAGIISADSGELLVCPKLQTQGPILVFQDYQLFPHLSLYDNIAFGLDARGIRGQERRTRVARMLEFFGLAQRKDAYPGQLSGGEQQRCALARALILEPGLLLLDEPLANLDRNLKASTAEYLSSVQRELGISVLSVTHDQEEAMMVSHRIGILLDGRLEQLGEVEDVYYQPASLEAARFLGPVNEIPGPLRPHLGLGHGEGLYARAESIELEASASGKALVTRRRFFGRYISYLLEIEGVSLEVFSQNENISPGDRVDLSCSHAFSFGEHGLHPLQN